VKDIEHRIAAAAERLAPGLVALRRRLHQKPELAFEEHETSKAVASYLKDLPLSVTTGIGKTGVVAVLEGAKPGRTIGVRADMDALPIHEETGLAFASTVPGKMHACGHDVHTVIVLGVAAVLSELRDSLKGKVKLIFQPAEETLAGAPAMIADGVLDDPRVDAILGFHNWPAVEAGKVGFRHGTVMASADAFDLTLKGKAGHGAHPHRGVDALVAGAYFVTQLQTIVSREVAPLSPAVITVGEFHSGTARNVVAPRATLKGSVRTQEPGLAEAIEAAVRRLLDGMRTGMRIDYEMEWKRLTPVLQQNEPTLARVLESARTMLGAGNVIELDQPSMGSEDFAWFAEKVPAAHLRIGSRIDGLETSIHHANYDCNEAAIGVGVRVLARAALELAGG